VATYTLLTVAHVDLARDPDIINQICIHYQVPIGSYSYPTLLTLREFHCANCHLSAVTISNTTSNLTTPVLRRRSTT